MALARRAEESTNDYLQRMGSSWDNLRNQLMETRGALQDTQIELQDKDGQLGQVLVEQHCARKLHPAGQFVIQQTLIFGAVLLEEAKLQGKSLVVLPGFFVTLIGTVSAYATGHGRIGDAFMCALQASAAVLNIRATSKWGAGMAARNKDRAPPPAPADKEEE